MTIDGYRETGSTFVFALCVMASIMDVSGSDNVEMNVDSVNVFE